jgi:RNA methyltransferase, TrmH family
MSSGIKVNFSPFGLHFKKIYALLENYNSAMIWHDKSCMIKMATSTIASLQHPLVKHLVKLRENRDYRYESQRIVLCGLKLIQELAAHFHFHSLLLENGFSPSFKFETESLYHVTPQIIKKVSGVENPEPIAAEIEMPKPQDLSSSDFLLILDGISDPGNLGTLLRTARALGWDGAFLTLHSTDPFNEKAIRASQGAAFTLPWRSGSFEELTSLLRKKNRKLLAADARGNDLSTCRFSPPLALALGNEAHGLAAELKEGAEMIAIPMKGEMESLNVASAGAIMMYQLKNQSFG